MKKWGKWLGWWWAGCGAGAVVSLPLSLALMAEKLSFLIAKMQNVEREGFLPLIWPQKLLSLKKLYLFNSSLFIALPIGFLLGSIFWFILISKKRKKYLFLLIPLLLLSIIPPPFHSTKIFLFFRERILKDSIGGRELIRWYYRYTPLPAEVIKPFWGREQKILLYIGVPPNSFQRWLREERIIYRVRSSPPSSIEGYDLIVSEGKDVKSDLPLIFIRRGENPAPKIKEIPLPIGIRLLRTVLRISLFFLFPFYILMMITTFITGMLLSYNKRFFPLLLSLFLLFIFLFLPLFPVPRYRILKEKDLTSEELYSLSLEEDSYLSLAALRKLGNREDSTQYLKKILMREERWYNRLVAYNILIHRGWDGKI